MASGNPLDGEVEGGGLCSTRDTMRSWLTKILPENNALASGAEVATSIGRQSMSAKKDPGVISADSVEEPKPGNCRTCPDQPPFNPVPRCCEKCPKEKKQ